MNRSLPVRNPNLSTMSPLDSKQEQPMPSHDTSSIGTLIEKFNKASSTDDSAKTPTKTTETTKRKRLRFCKSSKSSQIQVETKTIEHHSSLSKQERNDYWYSPEEDKRCLKEAQDTVISMANGYSLDDTEFTSRGLEYMTPSGFDITTSSLDAVKLIMEEQERQRKEPDFDGVLDMELFAATVESVSRHRLRIAHLAAMKDARTIYGDGNFKTTEVGGRSRRSRSRSADARRGRLGKSVSGEALAQSTRRRRGSRGPLDRREKTRHSTPDVSSDDSEVKRRVEKTKSSNL